MNSQLVVNDYFIKEIIGTGTFGNVFKAIHPEHGCVALKKMKKEYRNLISQEKVDTFLSIKNDQFINCLGTFVETDNFYMIFAYCAYDTLANMISNMRKNNESLDEYDVSL
jgi:serine/threonine protein kinase